MTDLKHEIHIHSKPEKVFNAITTKNGLKSWWTSDVQKDDNQNKYVFGFNNHSFLLTMKVIKEVPNEYVEWECIDGFDEWINTRLQFNINISDDNISVLSFTHSNWKQTEGWFAKCNTDWGQLMYYLKDYIEGRNKVAFMK